MKSTKIIKTFKDPETGIIFKAELFRTDGGSYVWLTNDVKKKVKTKPDKWVVVSQA